MTPRSFATRQIRFFARSVSQPVIAGIAHGMARFWPRLDMISAQVRLWWQSRSLAQQFATAAAAVLLFGMAILGFWVSERIKQGVMHNSAASGALFMDSHIAPLVQELATGGEISQSYRAELDRTLTHAAISNRVSAIKIWRTDGVIAYSNWHEKIGLKFKPTPNFTRALAGGISAEFEGQYHEQDGRERALQGPLLEIYAPVRDRSTGRVIAISEFYEAGATIKAALGRAEAMSWIVVGLVTLGMMAALSGIVARGSRTIEEQRNRLTAQVSELSMLLADNRELSQKVRRLHHRTAVINEKLLRRVGADLHDGPAQLLSLALLRLDGLVPLVPPKAPEGSGGEGVQASAKGAAGCDLEKIRHSLQDAMKELRQICSGLALPELANATLADVVRMAVRAHEHRTESRVAVDISELPLVVPGELKTCVYRFVQEGLNNAFRHAQAQGQAALARADAGKIRIEIRDQGPGFGVTVDPSARRLGLSGLQDRIESLGGTMEIGPAVDGGTRLAAHFDLDQLPTVDAEDD